jgi:hypothetical protein
MEMNRDQQDFQPKSQEITTCSLQARAYLYLREQQHQAVAANLLNIHVSKAVWISKAVG